SCPSSSASSLRFDQTCLTLRVGSLARRWQSAPICSLPRCSWPPTTSTASGRNSAPSASPSPWSACQAKSVSRPSTARQSDSVIVLSIDELEFGIAVGRNDDRRQPHDEQVELGSCADLQRLAGACLQGVVLAHRAELAFR